MEDVRKQMKALRKEQGLDKVKEVQVTDRMLQLLTKYTFDTCKYYDHPFNPPPSYRQQEKERVDDGGEKGP